MVETGRNAPRLWRYRADWIPAYAGMTEWGDGNTVNTIMECGMDSEFQRYAKRRTQRAPSPYSPEATSFPRKREPTPRQPMGRDSRLCGNDDHGARAPETDMAN